MFNLLNLSDLHVHKPKTFYMAIKFNMRKFKKDILVVKTKGYDENLAEVRNYNEVVKAEAERLKCDKVLCDERELEYRLSIPETYELANSLSEAIKDFKKIAIVTNKGNQEAAEFWETVAINRGVVAQVFYDFIEAKKWLLNS